MSVGTPGFVGSRLREAREARQLTGRALAELVGVTKAAISGYEHGRISPSPDVLEVIGEKLKFKTDFFLRPAEKTVDKVAQTFFERSRSSTTKSTRMRARHRQTWLREIVHYLSQFVSLPEPNLPNLSEMQIGAVAWLNLSPERIEQAARVARLHWNLGHGPISNVTLLSEKQGSIVTVIEMGAASLDAFSTWDSIDGRPYIVLGSDTQSSFRTRFNVCHELGHLILHRRVLQTEFNDRFNFRAIEAQADRFAAAFLTPASTFSSDITTPSLEQFRTLKPRWRVSIKMMIHRAQELEVIDREEARRFYISYNRRGWHRQEPLDDTYQLEEPRLVRREFETIVDKSVLDRSQVEADLPFDREEVEDLANLPHGYLAEDSAYTWAVKELESGFQ